MTTEQPHGATPLFFVAVFWISLIGLTLLSLVPVDHLPDRVMDIWDKAQHSLGFAWVTTWGLLAHPRRNAAVATGLLLWGGLIEVLQAASGWRQGDPLDMLANAIGVAAAMLVWRALRAWRARTIAS